MAAPEPVTPLESRPVELPFWLSAPSYWQPEHVVTSAWLTHAPFAFWLVDVLRPSSIAELGTHMGFSCFVFAEAAQRLGLGTTIAACDSWEGDDHAGYYGDEVYHAVQSIVEQDYADSVRMIRGYFEDSRPGFAEASVDLLHIDGRHGYEDVRADYTAWRSTVRDGGVILFHDIAEHQEGFGVWRLWDELRMEHPTFTFEHGHGLGVLGVGEVEDDRLRALFAADDVTADTIRADYIRLGDVVARQSRLEAMPAEVASLHDTVANLSAEIDRLAAAERALSDKLRAVHTSTSWRVTRPLRAVGRLRRRHDR